MESDTKSVGFVPFPCQEHVDEFVFRIFSPVLAFGFRKTSGNPQVSSSRINYYGTTGSTTYYEIVMAMMTDGRHQRRVRYYRV